jgi:hypothetical protein
MKLRWLAFVLLLLAGRVFAQASMPIMELTIGFHRIEAEVAATSSTSKTCSRKPKTTIAPSARPVTRWK